MNLEEAKNELARMKSTKFLFNFGALCGIALTLGILGLSFIEPHLDFIITVSIWLIIGVGLYLMYLLYKLKKIEQILLSSNVTGDKNEV